MATIEQEEYLARLQNELADVKAENLKLRKALEEASANAQHLARIILAAQNVLVIAGVVQK